MRRLEITYKAPARLKSREHNPRSHSRRQIQQIAASIEQFGFLSAILIDGSDCIIAGHGRVEAAKLLGTRAVPTTCVDHLSPAQIRAFVIADNRLAELAGWDRELLALELQELTFLPNFDVTITGFDTADVDILIGELGDDATPDDTDLSPPRLGSARPGGAAPDEPRRDGERKRR